MLQTNTWIDRHFCTDLIIHWIKADWNLWWGQRDEGQAHSEKRFTSSLTLPPPPVSHSLGDRLCMFTLKIHFRESIRKEMEFVGNENGNGKISTQVGNESGNWKICVLAKPNNRIFDGESHWKGIIIHTSTIWRGKTAMFWAETSFISNHDLPNMIWYELN